MTNERSTTKKKSAGRLGDHARDGIVVIKVGPESVSYHVLKTLLAQHSGYFDRALNGNWKEADAGVVTLDDVDCNTFELFLGWLYTQTLPTKASDWVVKTLSQRRPDYQSFDMALVRARVFADRFLSPAFGRVVGCQLIYCLVNHCNAHYEVVNYAYGHLPAEDPILKAIVDSHCFHFRHGLEDDEEKSRRKSLPHEFLVSVMLRYMEITTKRAYARMDFDKYHSHDSQEEKQACIVATKAMIYDL